MNYFAYLEDQADIARTEERMERRARFGTAPTYDYYDIVKAEFEQALDDSYAQEVEDERSGAS